MSCGLRSLLQPSSEQPSIKYVFFYFSFFLMKPDLAQLSTMSQKALKNIAVVTSCNMLKMKENLDEDYT